MKLSTDPEYRAALKEVEDLMGAEKGTSEGARLDALATAIEAYENEHYPIGESLLHQVGEALYGSRWQSELARAIAVSDRTVRRWATGTDAVPPGAWRDLHRIAGERTAGLAALLDKLAEAARG